MALAYSKNLAKGTPAPAFSLPDLDGKTYSLDSFADAKALVVIFTCNHCPYAKAYEDRLVTIARDYTPKGVAFVAINPNVLTHPQDSLELMRERAAEKGFVFPYLRDDAQDATRAYDAMCTPDVYVFDAARKLVCQTRVDDSWQDASKVTRKDLCLVLDAVLAGRAPPFDPVMPMGCSIKWATP